MKKCVIFFAVLLVTLIIAVWVEKYQEPVSQEELVLQQPMSKFLSTEVSRSE